MATVRFSNENFDNSTHCELEEEKLLAQEQCRKQLLKIFGPELIRMNPTIKPAQRGFDYAASAAKFCG